MSAVCEQGFITAKEIMTSSDVDLLPQYLYNDLKMMRDAELIERSFSEEKQCFVYSIKNNLIKVNLITKSVELSHEQHQTIQ